MLSAVSVGGVIIRLTDERWVHIVESHDDLAGHRDLILQAIESPDRVHSGYEGAHVAVKKMGTDKKLIVVYRETGRDGFVVTAYLTNKQPKGKVVWQK